MVGVTVHELPRTLGVPDRCKKWVEQVHGPFVSQNPARADREWDWEMQIPLLTFAAGAIRRPRMFQLCLARGDFPIAMVALLERERRIGDQRQPAVYVWYLTGAPLEAVDAHGAPRLITAAALDIAVTISLESAAQGHLWLHAAPEGGGTLMDWYRKKGLESVPLGTRLPGPVGGRTNDGRYFRLAPHSAKAVSDSMNAYRA